MSGNNALRYFKAFIAFCLVVGFLYFFLVSLDLMGKSLQVLIGDNAANMFSSIDNPLAGLTIGVLVTVMFQSSSTTTSIVVALVGANTLSVDQAVYIIFGANIGTSVTNTLVCLGFMGDKDNYRRGFAAATVHDMFNVLNVAFWFPIEWISDAINNYNGGVYTLMTDAMVKNFELGEGETWDNPIKKATNVIVKAMIDMNSDVLKDYAFGEPNVDLCEILCDTTDANATSCDPHSFFDKRCSTSPYAVPSTICNGDNSDAKAAFDYCESPIAVNQTILDAAIAHYEAAEPNKGGWLYPLQSTAGVINLVISFFMMFTSLICMVKLLQWLVRGSAEKVLRRALNMNGYLAILIGTGITMLVQSSSITTATLTPLAALGTITLESMLPLTIGANLGTTITGVLAAMVGSSVDGFQIALVHIMFNVFGAVLFYPFPPLRRIPLRISKKLGDIAYISKPFPLIYIFGGFVVLPLILFGLSLCFTIAGTGGLIAGIIIIILLVVVMVYGVYWYKKKGGRERIDRWMQDKFVHADSTESTKNADNEPADSSDDSSTLQGEA